MPKIRKTGTMQPACVIPGRSLGNPVAGSIAGLERSGCPSYKSMSTIWKANGCCDGLRTGHGGRRQSRDDVTLLSSLLSFDGSSDLNFFEFEDEVDDVAEERFIRRKK